MSINIYASLLGADQGRLREETVAAMAAGVDGVHIDIMDHHYVPNLGLNPQICHALADLEVPMEVHLMVAPVEPVLTHFLSMPLTTIFVHAEVCEDIATVSRMVKDVCSLGVVWHPDQSLSTALSYQKWADEYLVMGVRPGFGGQAMLPDTCARVAQLAAEVSVPISVDGGVQSQHVPMLSEAGASAVVMGSALFAADDYKALVVDIKSLAGL